MHVTSRGAVRHRHGMPSRIGPMRTGSADDWVDQLIYAFNAHDAAAVGELMTADVEYVYWSDSAWTSLRGRESVIALLQRFDQEWSSDFVVRPTFAVVTTDGFAVEYTE